jgi:hypothetical protein
MPLRRSRWKDETVMPDDQELLEDEGARNIEELEDDDLFADQPEREMNAADDEADPFEPPVDPPVLPRGADGAEISGAVDEMDEEDVEGASFNDDEITVRVQRLLRRDAATSSLRIHVSTVDGIVTLRGIVQTYEDTDNAAEVAWRVPGVVDVLDELEVEE